MYVVAYELSWWIRDDQCTALSHDTITIIVGKAVCVPHNGALLSINFVFSFTV